MFKRVISNPDDVGRTEGKMSRTSGEMNDMIMNNTFGGGAVNTALPMLHKPDGGDGGVAEANNLDGGISLAIPPGAANAITPRQISQSEEVPMDTMEDTTAALEHVSMCSDDGDAMDGNVADSEKEENKGVRIDEDSSIPPFPCITKPESPNSMASSSLSDRSAHCHAAGPSVRGIGPNTVPARPNLVPPDGNGSGDRDTPADVRVGKIVSKDSKQSVASESASSTSEQTPASLHQSGTWGWGWYDDPYHQDSPNVSGAGGKLHSSPLRGKANSIDEKGEAGREEGSTKKSRKGKKKKKGGMLQFDAVAEPLKDIVEPQRESPAMAVTAPLYVLEENISSQKLWKKTAGNRPPQPVEERAFYEKLWAQNFARSRVTYEIPVEVLTASSPIALSPFADGSFGADGGGEHCHQISNYNLAAPFNPNAAHRIRGGKGGAGDSDVIDGPSDPATVKAAEADVAEATLSFRNNPVGIYFDQNRPRGNNLKITGPHHHHHTEVNKKVKGNNSGDDLTVLVRGDNVFGTTVSKSFQQEGDSSQDGAINGVVTVSVSIASYRVVESKKHGKYAQFLVIYCEGSFTETVGVWKRYSDFSALANKVTHGHEKCTSVLTGINPLAITEESDSEILPNAITSWRLLKKRQRWYRCLDAGYLSLKVFLLERFLHDILFESSNPGILRDFVGNAQGQKIN